MATEIQEPNDLPPGSITDDTASRYEILVYEKASDNAGIKKMGIAPWKGYLGFNSHKVNNVASYLGMPSDYAWDTDADIPYPDPTNHKYSLSDQVKALSDKLGIDTEPGTITDTLENRVHTAEGNITTLQTQVAATGTGLLDRVTTIEEEIGGGGGGSTPSINARLNTLEGYVGQPSSGEEPATGLLEVEEVVMTPSSGLKDEMVVAKQDISNLQTAVNDPDTGLSKLNDIVQNPTDGLVKQVQDLKSEVYRFSGSIISVDNPTATTQLNLSGGGSIAVPSGLKNGMVFDINPSSGDTITMTIDGGQPQTFNKGSNIAWTVPESGSPFFDELGMNINIDELKQMVKRNATESIPQDSTWSSQSLNLEDGVYQFTMSIKSSGRTKLSVIIVPFRAYVVDVQTITDIVDLNNNLSTYWNLDNDNNLLAKSVSNTRKITYMKIGDIV